MAIGFSLDRSSQVRYRDCVFSPRTGRGAVWLARLHGVQEVAGSSPVAPIFCPENAGAFFPCINAVSLLFLPSKPMFREVLPS